MMNEMKDSEEEEEKNNAETMAGGESYIQNGFYFFILEKVCGFI